MSWIFRTWETCSTWSIDLFFSEVRARGMDFCAISDEKQRALVKECVSQVALEYRNTILKKLCQKQLSGAEGGADRRPDHPGPDPSAAEGRF